MASAGLQKNTGCPRSAFDAGATTTYGPTRFLNQAEGEHKAEAGRVVRELFNLSRDHH